MKIKKILKKLIKWARTLFFALIPMVILLLVVEKIISGYWIIVFLIVLYSAEFLKNKDVYKMIFSSAILKAKTSKSLKTIDIEKEEKKKKKSV